jgi:tRNA threonylcarbamoyladenosine modification (KEOPS) complex Cgi121 subunit
MKTWHIREGFKIKECGTDFLALDLEDTGEIIIFHIDEVDNIIDALRRAKSHFAAKEIKEAELEALARWGKAKIPALD